jgi:HemY protein
MRNIIWLVLLAVAAVVAAVTFGRNDGLVSIFWGGWRADLSFNLAVILLLVGGATVMIAAQALLVLVTLPQRAAEWRALRRERAAQAALRESMAEFFSARYSRAQRAARRALDLHADGAGTDREFAVLAHLIAAGSLHRLSDRGRRDEQIEQLNNAARRAWRSAPRRRRCAPDGGRMGARRPRPRTRRTALLSELPPGVARRTQALRLKLRAARQSNAPLEALQTARLLANHQAFLAGLSRAACCARWPPRRCASAHDIDQLQQHLAAPGQPASGAMRVTVARAALSAPLHWARLRRRGNGCCPHWEGLARLEAEDRERIALALMRTVSGIGPEWLAWLQEAANGLRPRAGGAGGRRRRLCRTPALGQGAADARARGPRCRGST